MSKNSQADIPESIVINRPQRNQYLFSRPVETVRVLERFGLTPGKIIGDLLNSHKHHHDPTASEVLAWINKNKNIFTEIHKLHQNIAISIKEFSEEDIKLIVDIVESGKDQAISDILPVFLKDKKTSPPASFLSDDMFSRLYQSPRWEDWVAAATMTIHWAPSRTKEHIEWTNQKNHEMVTRIREKDYFEVKHVSGYGPDQANFEDDVNWLQFLLERLLNSTPGSEIHAASVRNILDLKDLIVNNYLDVIHAREYRAGDIDVARLIYDNHQVFLTENYERTQAAIWIINEYAPHTNLEEDDMFRHFVSLSQELMKSIVFNDFHIEKMVRHLMKLLDKKSSENVFANTDWPLRSLMNNAAVDNVIDAEGLIFVRNMCPGGSSDSWFAARMLLEAIKHPGKDILKAPLSNPKPYDYFSDYPLKTVRNFSVLNESNDTTVWIRAMRALGVSEESVKQLEIAKNMMGVDFSQTSSMQVAMQLIENPHKLENENQQVELELEGIKEMSDFH